MDSNLWAQLDVVSLHRRVLKLETALLNVELTKWYGLAASCALNLVLIVTLSLLAINC